MANATWKKHPLSGDFDEVANWSPATVPDGTAFFGTSKITDLFISTATNINGLTFNKHASHYRFDIPIGKQLAIDSGGIVLKGGSAKFTIVGALTFQSSTAAISTAGKALIANHGDLGFGNDSTAGRAKITSTDLVGFGSNAVAGSATINVSAGVVQFQGHSNAGSATITAGAFASINFFDNSDGANARLIAQASDTLVGFSGTAGPAGDHKVSAGSIAGAGTFQLGQNELTVGSNNRSTKVTGLIEDGGAFGGAGASLVKVGTGKLTLTHANNTYTGITGLGGGTLDVAAVDATGTGPLIFNPFVSGHKTLKIENPALTSHAFGTEIQFFHHDDTIDLAGLKFHTHAKATYDDTTHLLTVKSGHVVDTLNLTQPETSGVFKAKDDGHGGTKVVLVVPHAKSIAQAGVAEKQASEPHSNAHHAAVGVSTTGLIVDSFHFNDLAGLGAPSPSDMLDLGQISTGTWLVDAAHPDHGNPFLKGMESQLADKHHIDHGSDHDLRLLSLHELIL
jgi:autotransporter-associated beta strand protein